MQSTPFDQGPDEQNILYKTYRQQIGTAGGKTRTCKRKHTAHDAHEAGQGLGGPVAAVVERGKDIPRVPVVAKGPQRDDDGKEADDVDDEQHALELGEVSAQHRVAQHGEHDDRPQHQGALVRLRRVAGVVEGDQALDHGAAEVSDRGAGALPASYRQPAGDVAEELGAAARREHGHPVVLAARGGRDGQ